MEDNNTTKDLGMRIKNLREAKNYTQDYLAQKLGITQKAYSKIEANETRLPVDHLLKIAEVLETSVNKILEIDGSHTFNNYSTHNKEVVVINTITSDKLIELYDQLLKSKNEEIATLKEQLKQRR